MVSPLNIHHVLKIDIISLRAVISVTAVNPQIAVKRIRYILACYSYRVLWEEPLNRNEEKLD